MLSVDMNILRSICENVEYIVDDCIPNPNPCVGNGKKWNRNIGSCVSWE